MAPNRKCILRIVALCLVMSMGICLAACRNNGEGPANGEEITYNLTVKNQGGVALSEISVYIYENDSLQDLIAVIATDKDGNASFQYRSGKGYVAVLGNVPSGYTAEKFYPITGENTEIVLSIQLVDGDLETASFKLGDVMQNFTFTDINGNTYKLSELLQQKKAVVLNFWTLDNNQCKMELPYLQEAYDEYADSVALLAMNPADSDSAAIAAIAEEFGLTFPIGSCESSWADAMKILSYPTTVVIDCYGMITLINSGSFPGAVAIKDVFAFFTAEDYTQTVVENLEDILVSEPEDDYNNPVDISGQSSFELTIDPGKVHYLNIHKVSNVWLQVNNSDIYVEYGGKKFTAQGGTIGLLVSAPSTFEPAQLAFGNSGTETQTFTVTLSNLGGSYDNPYTLSIGKFSASVSAGNNQGVYFKYTAPEDGYFSLQCLGVSPSVKYGFSVMNLTTSAMRTMEDDGVVDEETGSKAVTMAMNAGEQLRITISALPDDSNNYPAATFQMLAEFTAGDVEDIVVVEKIPYAVTVTDENGNPVPHVNINLVGTVPEEPETEGETEGETVPAEPYKASLATDENGVAALKLPKDTYTGSLIVPSGYKATTTGFTLTPENPFLSLKIDTHVIVMEDYTVRVVDEDGNPIPGVLITIGTNFGTTDADGVVTINLEKGEYTAIIGAPDGYYAEEISVDFAEGSNVLGITLKKGSGETVGVEYTVHVVDANGDALKNIVVTFNQNGKPVTMAVAATGTATATLPAGTYTVSLTSSSGATLKFEAAQAVLTEEKTSTTITVAEKIDSNSMDSAWWGYYYKISTGSMWIDLADTQNYSEDYGCYMYVFLPETSGIYRFSASDGAVVGYYGAVNFPNGPSYSTDNEDGYFEITIRDGEFESGNQPALVIGLQRTGNVVDAMLTVVRVADAPEELPRVEYEPTCEIVQTGTISGARTYIDLTQSVTIEKGSDGYYYLNGKKLYMNISNSAPFLTFNQMLGLNYDAATGQWVSGSTGTGMRGIIYEDGVAVFVEDYTLCMSNYIKASDPVSGLYPLNDDLIHMVQVAGAYMCWWDIDNPNYLFTTVEGLNPDIAWMFAVCTAG